jgi:hypothetical protein
MSKSGTARRNAAGRGVGGITTQSTEVPMRNRVLVSAFAGLAVLALAAAYAPAQSSQAAIFNSTAVFWFDGDGNALLIPDANIQVVVTNNSRGNVNVRGFGTLPEGAVLPTRTMHWDNENTGYICGFGGTVEFSGVTTPSGQFSFTCKAP